MITIALTSATGGSGRTSIALNLAQLLMEQGRDVILVQADPINMLNFQVAMPEPVSQGLAQVLQGDCILDDAIIQLESGLNTLFFGQTTSESRKSLEQLVSNNTEKLVSAFTSTHIKPNTILVVDLPRWPSVWCDLFLAISDLNLVSMVPDASSILAADLIMSSLQASRGASYFLMNRFESIHVLHLDLWTLCKVKLSHRLLPFYLHQDQALPEAFASGQMLKNYAPQSQLTEDFQKLCNWIDMELG
jgi:cellulose synthase operon protein YhjQ